MEKFQSKKWKKKCFTDSMKLKRLWIHLKRVKRGNDNKKRNKSKKLKKAGWTKKRLKRKIKPLHTLKPHADIV